MSVKKKVIILVSICIVILIGAVVADRIIGKNYFNEIKTSYGNVQRNTQIGNFFHS